MAFIVIVLIKYQMLPDLRVRHFRIQFEKGWNIGFLEEQDNVSVCSSDDSRSMFLFVRR